MAFQVYGFFYSFFKTIFPLWLKEPVRTEQASWVRAEMFSKKQQESPDHKLFYVQKKISLSWMTEHLAIPVPDKEDITIFHIRKYRHATRLK